MLYFATYHKHIALYLIPKVTSCKRVVPDCPCWDSLMVKAPSLPIKLTPQDDLSAADLLREAVHSGGWHDGQVPAGLPFCSDALNPDQIPLGELW